MSDTDLQALEQFVVENDDLLALEEQIGRFNIFDALNIARAEIRHSNYLAWLLTPGESHGQGDLFLKPLLMDLLRKARQQGVTPPVSPIELDGADLQSVEIRREWRSIDLLITCDQPRFVIAIENKVDSGEHSNQLQRYEDTVASEYPEAKQLFVFLTPGGEEASDDDWIAYSYADLHQVIARARKANAGAIGGDVGVFLGHYLGLIGSRFMENEEIDKLCRQIYSNHRRALDLIWEKVGTPAAGLIGAIDRWVQERPQEWTLISTKEKEVEFVPAGWSRMLPPVARRKTFAAEHWVTIRLCAWNERLRLFVVVWPTTETSIRKQAVERLLRDKAEFGFATMLKKENLTDSSTRILSEALHTWAEDEEPDPEVIMPKVEKRLAELAQRTAGLPQAMRALFEAPNGEGSHVARP